MTNEEKTNSIVDGNYYTTIGEKNAAYNAALDMAEWKDKNPSVETIKKIVVYALRRTNIMLADDLENGVEWELLIKKALK